MISRGQLKDINFNKEGVDQNAYPFNLPFFTQHEGMRIHPSVTFLVGENGSGKSTLLEAIAVASGFNPEGGSLNFNFNTRPSHSDLHKHLRTSRGVHRHTDGFFLRGESFFNVATNIEDLDKDPDDGPSAGGPKIINSYGGQSLHEQSHGESFWALFSNRFFGNGFYILDEPESALSPTRQFAMLKHMARLVSANSQFIIATHSPILITYPDAVIYELSSTGMEKKRFQQTQLFRTYRDFFNDPLAVIDRLMDEADDEEESPKENDDD